VLNLIQWIKAKERKLPLVAIQTRVSLCFLSLVPVGIGALIVGTIVLRIRASLL